MRLGICLVSVGLALVFSCKPSVDGDGATDATDGTDDGTTDEPDVPYTGEDVDMTMEDFPCIDELTSVRSFFVTNVLGHEAEAVALANNPQPGVQYPVGTIIQIFPFEAMVKRHPGWNPDSQDWEFFALNLGFDDTVKPHIEQRGADEVTSQFDLSCKECHEKAREYDYVCERTRGCVEKGITSEAVALLQYMDPRCRTDTGGWDTGGIWPGEGPL